MSTMPTASTPNDQPLVEFRDVDKTYGDRAILGGVSLSVGAGDFMVVYGPPASGKTVLMRLVMGLEQPTAGAIWLRGQDVRSVSAADRNVGYVPQSFALYPHISVADNIAYPLTLAGIRRQEAEPIVQHAAEMLKIGDLLGKRPDQLSGGQKQRVAIARGIAKQTDLFVLDDPLAGLDFKLREQLVDDLRQLQVDSHATFLYTTSDAIEALTLADHVAVLSAGRIVEAGLPEHLYDVPRRAETMQLLGFPRANFLAGTVETRDGALWCTTDAFAFPVHIADGNAAAWTGKTFRVGVRPESVVLGRAAGAGRDGWPRTPARVLLQEDLGGEEIIYLDAGGTLLTTVVRHDELGEAIPEQTTVSLDPRDLVLFAPDGERIGAGAVARDG